MSTATPSTASDHSVGHFNFGRLIGDSEFVSNFSVDEEAGTATVTGVPVFKAGTFTDAYGYTETWSRENLAQMASNFAMLSDSFPNVPIREDHSRSIDKVVGYVTDLRLEGEMLLADFELTEERAIRRWSSGTYRGRSTEIGFWDSEDGAMYWPVFVGVAFVDIPAVEGLYSKANPQTDGIRFFREADMTVTTTDTTNQADDTEGTPDVIVTEPEAAFTKPLEAAKFTIDGVEITDPKEVQAHIDRLSAFAREQRDAARLKFAADLVSSNKLAAPQQESMAEFAQGLSDEQFKQLEAVFAAATPMSLFSDHADTVTNPDNEGNETELDKQIADAEEVVRMHTKSGMTQEQIEKTASYTKLQALRASKGK